MRTTTVVGLLVIMSLSGVLAAGAQPAAVRTAIEAANKTFTDAMAKGDAAAMASGYAPDGELLPPNADVVRGRDAIQKMWQGFLDSGAAGLSLNITDVHSSGDLASETGTYEVKMKDGTTTDRGKYVVVWKRVQGKWLIYRDIWNSNAAPK